MKLKNENLYYNKEFLKQILKEIKLKKIIINLKEK